MMSRGMLAGKGRPRYSPELGAGQTRESKGQERMVVPPRPRWQPKEPMPCEVCGRQCRMWVQCWRPRRQWQVREARQEHEGRPRRERRPLEGPYPRRPCLRSRRTTSCDAKDSFKSRCPLRRKWLVCRISLGTLTWPGLRRPRKERYVGNCTGFAADDSLVALGPGPFACAGFAIPTRLVAIRFLCGWWAGDP